MLHMPTTFLPMATLRWTPDGHTKIHKDEDRRRAVEREKREQGCIFVILDTLHLVAALCAHLCEEYYISKSPVVLMRAVNVYSADFIDGSFDEVLSPDESRSSADCQPRT